MSLTREQLEEVSELYWDEEYSTTEIQSCYGITKPLHQIIIPQKSDEDCPNCSAKLVYTSRSSRTANRKTCLECPHKANGWRCQCPHCTEIRQAEQKIVRQERLAREIQVYQEALASCSNDEYVEWAVSKLKRREKLVTRAILEEMKKDEFSWKRVCLNAGVVSQENYISRLVQLKLILEHPVKGLIINPNLTLEFIKVKKVRNISKGLRFDVFQRDEHTCQYCGRSAPDVELELDHIHPVAEGGTDDLDNLTTSCFDCNRGKSAKIIELNTGGQTQEERRQSLKEKRKAILLEKQERLEEVLVYWANARGRQRISLSDYDRTGILRMLETYEIQWIKDAIDIAVKTNPSNYVKYVFGILRRWGSEGRESEKEGLKKRPASEKQVAYIKVLLASLDLKLEDIYHKSEDELNMLDATTLIGDLKLRSR